MAVGRPPMEPGHGQHRAARQTDQWRDARPATAGRSTTSWRLGVLAGAVLAVGMIAAGMWGMFGVVPGMGGHMGSGGRTDTSTKPFADARQISVDAGDLWFEPDRITVTAAEPVNLRLANTGAAFHDLTVPAADLMLDAQPGNTVTGGLRLDEPGTYEFYCSVPGHAEAGMRGTIVVVAE